MSIAETSVYLRVIIMKELVNLSLHEDDMAIFGSDWNNVRIFLNKHELDGVELFVDSSPLPELPSDLIEGVHLPYWMGRHRAWADHLAFSEDMDKTEKVFTFGGCSRREVIDNFKGSMNNASILDASYAVFHVSYAEMEQVFTGSFGCTDFEVLETTANFLNESVSAYPGGEPPVRLFFENLWWPGLTFLKPRNVEFFIDLLDFSNWAFVLDTGHLMNATMGCYEEKCSIDTVLQILSMHSDDTIERIEGIHFHCSLTGDYMTRRFGRGTPKGFEDGSFSDRLASTMGALEQMDQHMPFTSDGCYRIVDYISPDFLTHEFVYSNLSSLDEKISIQRGALHK